MYGTHLLLYVSFNVFNFPPVEHFHLKRFTYRRKEERDDFSLNPTHSCLTAVLFQLAVAHALLRHFENLQLSYDCCNPWLFLYI